MEKIKTFLIFWILIQLILIGIAGGNILIDFKNNKNDECVNEHSNFKLRFIALSFPLVFFLSEMDCP